MRFLSGVGLNGSDAHSDSGQHSSGAITPHVLQPNPTQSGDSPKPYELNPTQMFFDELLELIEEHTRDELEHNWSN